MEPAPCLGAFSLTDITQISLAVFILLLDAITGQILTALLGIVYNRRFLVIKRAEKNSLFFFLLVIA